MGNASGKANRTHAKRAHAKRAHAKRAHAKRTHSHAKRTHTKRTKNRTHKRKGGAKPSPLGKGVSSPHDESKGVSSGVSSPHDERGSVPSNPTASRIAISRLSSLVGETPSKRRKKTKKQPPLLPSVLIREALKLGTPPIKSIAPASKKINRNFKVTVSTSSSPKHKSI